MNWIAVKMLLGDRSKSIALVFGIAFACCPVAEQSSNFCGIILIVNSAPNS